MARSLRLIIPIVLCVIGVVVVVAGNFGDGALGIGCAIIAASSSVGLLNWFYHFGVDGDLERDKEQEARDFFAEHGRWPRAGEHPTQPSSH